MASDAEWREQLHAWMAATIPRAVAYATTLLRDRQQAEDVVHDCYCRLLRRAEKYDLARDGTKLLFKSITNACLTLNTRARPILSLDGLAAGGQSVGQLVDRTSRPPECIAMHKELEQAVGQGLARLPLRQRAALELTSLGHSQQEIAEVLGTSTGHVGILVHRARQAMAGFLAPFLGEAAG